LSNIALYGEEKYAVAIFKKDFCNFQESKPIFKAFWPNFKHFLKIDIVKNQRRSQPPRPTPNRNVVSGF